MDLEQTDDTNIDNYSIDDILILLNLNPTASEFQIRESAQRIINKMRYDGKREIALFFKQARDKVLKQMRPTYAKNQAALEDEEDQEAQAKMAALAEGLDAGGLNQDMNENIVQEIDENDWLAEEDTQEGNWYHNEYPAQENNPGQTEKYTERKQKVQIANDVSHFQMNRERLGINESYSLPVRQGTMNPTLKNLTSQLVVIDSQYRQNILPYLPNDPNSPAYNTDYTLDLTDPMKNVLSLKLYSIQIPTTWYAFEAAIGNTCFLLNGTPLQITSGNYKTATALGAEFQTQTGGLITVTFNNITGCLTFTNTSPTAAATLTFYNTQTALCPNQQQCGPGAKINQNLGWNLGFRLEPVNGIISIIIPPTGTITASAPADIYGPKYLILVVDDYNNHHLNNGLVNISKTVTKVDLPAYYTTANQVCVNNTVQVGKSAPRTLTQAQLYSLNEILINRQISDNRLPGPTTTDVLAVLPLSNISLVRPDPYIQFGPTIQSNERQYFGPVNVERLRVRLLDDKGNLLNLHDNDWSFTLIVEQLYQY